MLSLIEILRFVRPIPYFIPPFSLWLDDTNHFRHFLDQSESSNSWPVRQIFFLDHSLSFVLSKKASWFRFAFNWNAFSKFCFIFVLIFFFRLLPSSFRTMPGLFASTITIRRHLLLFLFYEFVWSISISSFFTCFRSYTFQALPVFFCMSLSIFVVFFLESSFNF